MGAPLFFVLMNRIRRGLSKSATLAFHCELWHSVSMKSKNMKEMEKHWAKKAAEQSGPKQKTGAAARQTPTHTTRSTRKASRGR
jgi:hypothetical protein